MSDFQHASLDWDEQGQPLSSTFGDVYFSRASGLDETRHVFLAQNALAERFAALKTEFAAQLKEEAKLNQAIAENLAKVKV